MVFRLEDFDFLDCARECLYIFFMKQQVKERVMIIANAGKVYWSDIFADRKESGEGRG